MSWYVLSTRSGHEFAVRDAVQRFGISCFVPVRLKQKRCRRAGRRRVRCLVKVPAFRGCVLANLDERNMSQWARLCTVNDLIGFLHVGGKPLVIRGEPLEAVTCLARSVRGAETDRTILCA